MDTNDATLSIGHITITALLTFTTITFFLPIIALAQHPAHHGQPQLHQQAPLPLPDQSPLPEKTISPFINQTQQSGTMSSSWVMEALKHVNDARQAIQDDDTIAALNHLNLIERQLLDINMSQTSGPTVGTNKTMLSPTMK